MPRLRSLRAEERAALPVPPELRADATGAVRLSIDQGSRTWVAAGPTPTFGFNGDYLGPAIRTRRGERIDVTVDNTLEETATVHWHGLIIPGEADGGPHNRIAGKASWHARLEIDQPAATCWYHPHNYPSTAEQVLKGLAGLFIIEDEESAGLGLPQTWGVDDIPLILQDRRFNADGSFFHRFNMIAITTGYIGDRLLVNGVEYPYAVVASGWLRLRLLNGSNARSYRVAAADGRDLFVIAGDGGLLEAPVRVKEVALSSGERFEVLVDARDGLPFDLVTLPVTDQVGMNLPPFDQPLPFVTLRPLGAAGTGRLPDRLAALPALPAALPPLTQEFVLKMRRDAEGMALLKQAGLGMGGMKMEDGATMGGITPMSMSMPMGPDPAVVERMTQLIVEGPVLTLGDQLSANEINGAAFDMTVKGFQAPRGELLRWAVSEGTDNMLHPFHMHGCQFRIISIGDKPPPAHLAGWKDTAVINSGGRAEFLVRFERTASERYPYMAHCHILEHEDSGMMTQFSVA